MKKEKTLFLIMLLVQVGLFALCGYSLIQCFVYGAETDEFGSHFLEITYLFLHLIMVAIIFYLTFRAFKIKATLLPLMTMDENRIKIVKNNVISLVLAILFLGIGFYSTLRISGLDVPLLNIFPTGLSHDLMNAGYLFGSIALMYFLYPYVYVKEDKIQAE